MTSRLKILIKCVQNAGTEVRNAIPTDGIIQKEGRANIVTSADLASEKAIVGLIRSKYADDDILSEETVSNSKNFLTANNLWVIDPIDGTNNYRYQRNYCCISVGYVEKGVVQAAAIYDPFRDELFTAEYKRGAYLNGRKISVSTQNDLRKASVATDNSYDPAGTRNNLELFLQITPSPWFIMKGSAVLTMCEVAAGRIDLYFHTALKPWDNAAAFLVAQEAGGTVIGLDGREVNFLSTQAIVGNNSLVQKAIKTINRR